MKSNLGVPEQKAGDPDAVTWYISDSFLTAHFVRGKEGHQHVMHTKARKRGGVFLKEESPGKDILKTYCLF